MLVVLCSCSSYSNLEHSELEKLYVDWDDNDISLCDISNSVSPEFDFIRLETTDACLLGYIDRIIYENDRYYFLDKTNGVISCFSGKGKYLFTLNHTGQGPDEYINIDAFTVENDNIWIFDGQSLKVLCYDIDQKVIDRISLKESGFWASDMTTWKDIFI